ncbi:hypothetical protein [uncultured Lacinutrix sp.]|uniref:GldL-related protein n=1 Tax=uncultured Lacinutrix sp. TaxID=574032 RepID=UPI002618A3EC|nr:hypothetical protein [uncultured Lacinutrix sp.]
MKAKQFILPLIIFILGIILTIIGALFKIQHWPYASQILTLGTIAEVIGLVFFIVVLIKYFFKK